jgi:hypothetical protein
MKTSNVIASLFFGSLAAAVPYKRNLSTKTEVVVETVVVFTTVWDDGSAAAVATTTAAAFFEQSPQASSSAAKTTSTSAYVAPVVASSTSVYVAPSSASSPSVYTPPVPSSVYTPSAGTSSVYTPPSSTSGAATPSGTPGSIPEVPPVAGKTYSGGDVTIYNTGGVAGMCNKGQETLTDSMMIVAMSKLMIGDRMNDVMTGAATNQWCGKKLSVTYKDRAPIVVTVMDRCAGCEKATDLDFTPTAWKALTGTDEVTRYEDMTTWKVID